MPAHACPECQASVPSPRQEANPAPHPDKQFMTCLQCGARLERPLAGDAGWQRQTAAS
jgi:hypothetical protein